MPRRPASAKATVGKQDPKNNQNTSNKKAPSLLSWFGAFF